MANISNIFVDRGATLREVIDLKNDDGSEFRLTDYVVSGYAEKHQDSAVRIPFTFAVDNATNNITFSLTPAQTAELSIMTYIFAVYITSVLSGDVIKIASGNMIVSP